MTDWASLLVAVLLPLVPALVPPSPRSSLSLPHSCSTNVPDGVCIYNRTRDCPTTYLPRSTIPLACVDGAILNYTSQLLTGRYMGRALSAPLLNEALKYLLHYVGDVHQPLHVGFASDAGGNTLSGKFFAANSVSLHTVWDQNILARRDNDFGGQAGYTQWLTQSVNASNDAALYRDNLTDWLSCAGSTAPASVVVGACPDVWSQQSLSIACDYSYVYPNGTRIRDGFVLAEAYYTRVVGQLDAQMARCGIRLAGVLNSIFGARVPPPPAAPGPQSLVFLLNLPFASLAANFSRALEMDVALALSVNASRLAVASVVAGPVAGTVLVQLVVSEPLDLTVEAALAARQTAENVASLIVDALNDPASAAYTADPQSRLAHTVTGSAALQGAPGAAGDSSSSSSTADDGTSGAGVGGGSSSTAGGGGSGSPVGSSDAGESGPLILGAPLLYGLLAIILVTVACALAIWYCCCVVRPRAIGGEKTRSLQNQRLRAESEMTSASNPLHWSALEAGSPRH